MTTKGHHLSCFYITAKVIATYPSTLAEPASSVDIRGIAAHKVYPIYVLLQKPVSSYLTFSPLPAVALAKAGITQPLISEG
jgi:hypothetical protein